MLFSLIILALFVIPCANWYHLYNLKNVKNIHRGVLLLVKLQACTFTKSKTPPWLFFTFFKLYKWYQIAPKCLKSFLIFALDEIHNLLNQAGFDKVQNIIDRRLQVNRGRQLKMYRVWVQCKYKKKLKEAKVENDP